MPPKNWGQHWQPRWRGENGPETQFLGDVEPRCPEVQRVRQRSEPFDWLDCPLEYPCASTSCLRACETCKRGFRNGYLRP